MTTRLLVLNWAQPCEALGSIESYKRRSSISSFRRTAIIRPDHS